MDSVTTVPRSMATIGLILIKPVHKNNKHLYKACKGFLYVTHMNQSVINTFFLTHIHFPLQIFNFLYGGVFS